MYMESIIPERRKKRYLKRSDDHLGKLYFIHHMHHFKSGKDIEHELHHCFLFEKKNMAGKKYSVVHRTIKNKLFHCLEADFEGILYDHANNTYMIARKKIDGKRISAIKIK